MELRQSNRIAQFERLTVDLFCATESKYLNKNVSFYLACQKQGKSKQQNIVIRGEMHASELLNYHDVHYYTQYRYLYSIIY